MATRKFIIEVEEGNTYCTQCPFVLKDCEEFKGPCNCVKYNLATMKITEMEDKK